MPIAGQLTDRTGVGRIVLVGLTLITGATLALTGVEADTSYWTVGGILFLTGMGMGATMMPIMFGAMQTLRRTAVVRASTTINILQQVGASIGTAVLSVTLARALGDGAMAAIPDAVREQLAPLMTGAYGDTFWWAVGLLVAAYLGAVMLPWRKPAGEDTGDAAAGEQPALALMHV